ncbi:MAG TPA: class I SAM-dependent rRNA methyltransferase [Myxococcota bacterium]|nr:class I SAM-dependent rRNA methyltransferase [Myxococcota bacterium]
MARPSGVTPRSVTVRLTNSAERWVRKEHPWLYAESIRSHSRPGQAGDLAVIFDRHRKLLALGLWDPDSPIRVRVLHRGGPRPVDRTFFAERLRTAAEKRAHLAGEGTTGWRVANGESDGLPGLVVDRYEGTVVLKLYTAAWLPHLPEVLAALGESLAPERVVARTARAIAAVCAERAGLRDGDVLAGPPLDAPIVFREAGLALRCDPARGQKTGWFLDQRENRARVGALAQGRNVLDAFAYTGGFSLHAARGGAARVLSLDASRIALDESLANFALNRADPQVARCAHELAQGDAFEELPRLAAAGRRFELVVVDPPALTRTQADVAGALHAYARLAESAARLLAPGADLVMASCSARVDADALAGAVRQGAARAGRRLRERERTAHACDHPVGFPEAAYLKCLFLRAE